MNPFATMRGEAPRIGLVVDHPKRDLEGLVLLARGLAQRGARPVLLPMYQQGIDLALLGLDAVVVNYVRGNNASALADWHEAGIAVFVLDTEGGVLSQAAYDSPQHFADRLRRLGASRSVDGYMFWGSHLANAVQQAAVLPSARVAVTGCPRFDLCSEPWRGRLGPRSGDYVLINTNFSLVNPALNRSELQERQVMAQAGWDLEYADRLIEDQKRLFVAYNDFLETVFKSEPSVPFRVRPHPFEDQSFYLRRFEGCPNVEVNGTGGVHAAIQRARLVLLLNCGSAVDALMLGRVPVQLECLNTPIQRRHSPLPARLSLPVLSLEELRGVIAKAAEIEAAYDFHGISARELEPYFGPLDGRSGERAAECLMTWLGERTRSRARRHWRLAVNGGRSQPRIGQRLQGFASVAAGSAAVARIRETARPARSAKQLSPAVINRVLDEFETVAPTGLALRARRARHPLTALPLTSVVVETAGSSRPPVAA